MKLSLLSLALLAAPSPAEFVNPRHPVLERILALYDGKEVQVSCRRLMEREFALIASRERYESGVILKNLKQGGCQLDFLAVGERDFVERDLELYDRLMSDPKAASVIDLHVHPLANVEYFREGTPYKGEIMFATHGAIREAQLPPELYDKLVELIQQGKAPGFNLSPPSNQDHLASTAANPLPATYAVATSAGIWESSVLPGKTPSMIRERIESFVVYSSMYETAFSETASPNKKARARRLFDLNMEDAETRRIYLEWQACSLALRRPYTKAAVEDLLKGDSTKVRAEFEEKLAFARRWSALMREIGFELSFKPFPRS